MKILLFIVTLFLVNNLCATTFLPLPIERQIAESTLVVEAEYQNKEYKKVNEVVLTEFNFKVKRYSGNGDAITDWMSLKVLSPGGVWQGVVYHTFGTPKFEERETYLLLLKKNEVGFGFLNLSLGKYDIKFIDGKKIYSPSIFSEHPILGNINEEKINRALTEKFQVPFKEVYTPNKQTKAIVSSDSKENIRRPSAIEESRSKAADSTISILWLILILAVLGSIATIKFRH